MTFLPKKHQSICSNLGTFGILIASTCLIQQMIFSANTWLSFALAGAYLFSILAFLLLVLQKTVAPPLLIISTSLSFIAELMLIFSWAFSPVVVILFLYSLISVIVVYMEGVPQKLKEKALAIRMEELAWREKI